MGKSGRVKWPNETETPLAAESEAENRQKPNLRVGEERREVEIARFRNGKEGRFTTTLSIIFLVKKFQQTENFASCLDPKS